MLDEFWKILRYIKITRFKHQEELLGLVLYTVEIQKRMKQISMIYNIFLYTNVTS
jgi:hypothetical protein